MPWPATRPIPGHPSISNCLPIDPNRLAMRVSTAWPLASAAYRAFRPSAALPEWQPAAMAGGVPANTMMSGA